MRMSTSPRDFNIRLQGELAHHKEQWELQMLEQVERERMEMEAKVRVRA